MTTLAGRIVDEQTNEVMAQMDLENLVSQMAAIVDSNIEPATYRGGSIVYQPSIENPDDWEVVVVTRLVISRQERFDLSLRIGEALNRTITAGPSDASWNRVAFGLNPVMPR
jgi:hypothetical protein